MIKWVKCRLQDSAIASQRGKNVRRALILTALLAFATALHVFAQRPGEVTDPIVTTADTSQSYAVYLPSTYNTQRQWPVIFAFNPAARGRVPVELFRSAAESRGYIVVGSNNSRNGPAAPQVNAFLALVDDVQKRFSVDRQRFYADLGQAGTAISTSSGAVAAPRSDSVVTTLVLVTYCGHFDLGKADIGMWICVIDWLKENGDKSQIMKVSLLRSNSEV